MFGHVFAEKLFNAAYHTRHNFSAKINLFLQGVFPAQPLEIEPLFNRPYIFCAGKFTRCLKKLKAKRLNGEYCLRKFVAGSSKVKDWL
jgi:hypothetical protein